MDLFFAWLVDLAILVVARIVTAAWITFLILFGLPWLLFG